MGLRQKTVNGVIWTGLGTVGSGVIGFVVTMFLSRHLTPSDFGLIEIILSLVIIIEVFIDCGFSQAIIRENKVTQRDLSTVFYLNIFTGFILYLCIFIGAPCIARFYTSGPDFILVLRVLSTKIIFDSLAICQTANCNRLMRFEFLAKISIISMVISGILSVVGVYLGIGVWAIVIYYLGLSILKCFFLNVLNKWFPSLEFDTDKIRYFINFGGALMILKIADKSITSIESLCVGKTYSKADLGLFSQARRFENLIIQNMVSIVQKVTYPALSKISSEERLRSNYGDVMKIAVWIILPIAMYMFFYAEIFLYVFFGKQWVTAAPYLRLFSIFSMLDPLYEICWNVFLVKAQTRKLMYIGLCKQVLRALVLFITLQYSIIWFTAGIVVVMLAASLVYIYFSGELIGYPIKKMFKDNLGTFLISLMCIGMSRFFLSYTSLVTIPIIFFVFSLLISIFLYIVTSFVLKNNATILILSIVKEIYQNRSR